MTLVLPTTLIPRRPSILRLSRVPVPHTNDAVYALDGEGRRWVAKREADMGCEALLAEAITWLLARRVGVPVPDAAFCDDPAERAWLSAWEPRAKHWSVAAAGAVRNPEGAAAILALDAVVFNEARHGGNLLVVPHEAGGSGVLAIDADEALIGHPVELSGRDADVPEPRILARGFPPPGWLRLALAAATRFEELEERDLRDMAAAACDVAREPDPSPLVSVLIFRCRRAVTLTERYMNRVENRR